jgi:aspartyl-tRNA(Asn)/glutamyl-tRNA(Gln) amidotransferase subunit A
MTAASLRKAYLEGDSDPVDEIEACLQRCHDDRLNALITIDDEGALASARAASERYRSGCSLGLWDGVPFVAKDNIAAKGLPWTDGIEAYRGRIAEKDADIIAFLKKEGAVLIGKANLHEAALGTTNDNPWFGKCHNPHRFGYTPGGSSGGSGAAVGGGLVPLALGTDTMGSVRVPAAYCGVYGWKPGPGVLSQHGVTPLSLSLDTIGLIAASAADLDAYGASLAGSEPPDATALPTIGILVEEALATAEPNIRSLYGEAVETLRRAGCSIETVSWFDDPSANRRAGLALCITEAYGVHADGIAACPQGFSEELKGFLTFGRDFPSDKLEGSKMTIERLRRDGPKRWSAVDLVLTPTTPYPAHSFEQPAPDDLADFTAPANLIGLPASSLPYGRSEDGIPLGLQLIGKAGGDRELLAQTLVVDRILNRKKQEAPSC